MSVYLKKREDNTSAWYYDFMYKRHRYRGVGGTTKTQALRALEKKRNDVLSEEYDLSKPVGNPKFEDFVPVYLKRREHLKSRRRDRISANHLLNYFKGKVLLSISPGDIEDYIAGRRKTGISNATINRELACLSRMFTLAIKWGEAKKNPMADVDHLKEPPGRTRFLLEEEAQRLLACCDEHIKPIVMTALNTGMRLGEILGLKWDQVHIKAVIEPYVEVKVSKNNKKRFIPLNDDMIDLFYGMDDKKSGYVFLGTRNKALKSVRKPFDKALKSAGIIDFRFHDLRHTFASHYLMNGGDLLALKEILGHSSLKMVERYTHLAGAHKRKQINNINGKFRICHPIATLPKVLEMGSRIK